jgi:uncharacterized membrane protein YraQ (UPF0718 family)
MIVSGLILFAITFALALYANARQQAAIGVARQFTIDQGLRLAIRLPFALITATCLAALLPGDAVAALIGSESGVRGVMIAAFAGGLLPGGPMVSFPLAVALAGQGAGTAQLAALITGWSVFALHRVIAYESPLLGWRFVAVRLLASCLLPVLAGLAMLAVLQVTGDVGFSGAGAKVLSR